MNHNTPNSGDSTNHPQNPQEPFTPQGSQATDDVQAPEDSQNPEDPQAVQQPYGEESKKSKTGLWIGLGILLLAIITIVALAFFFFRNNSHIDSAEDFQQKMQEVGDKNGANQCSRYSDTVFAQASSEDQLREEIGKETNQNLDNFQIYLCSSIDLTNMESILNAPSTENPQMLMGFYNSEKVEWDDNFEIDGDTSETLKWAVAGNNWALLGSEPAVEEVVDIMGGEVVVSR